MLIRNLLRWPLCLALAALLFAGRAGADFVPVEDFDALVLGPIDDQNGWFAQSDSSMVVPDPADSGNQVLAVITESTRLYREALLLNGTVRMLFLRFRFGSQLSCSFGMSDSSFPDQFGDFEVELSLTNSADDLRINNGGTYDVLASLQPDTWYNCWLLINNLTDDTQIWLHPRAGDDASEADRLDAEGETVFEFRDGSAGDLRTFFIKTGGGNGVDGPLYLDDIYLEDTNELNLNNPVLTPASVLPIPTASPPILAQAFPNPFAAQTTIRLAPPEAGRVDLAIFDTAGRRLVDLLSGECEARPYAITWDGHDSSGRRLAPGIYFVRAGVGPTTDTQRLLILR